MLGNLQLKVEAPLHTVTKTDKGKDKTKEKIPPLYWHLASSRDDPFWTWHRRNHVVTARETTPKNGAKLLSRRETTVCEVFVWWYSTPRLRNRCAASFHE